MEIIVPQVLAAVSVFVGLPWLILHYVTQWKKAPTLTIEDEKLLDEMNDLARRLDERVCTIERIMTLENPNWRSLSCDPMTGVIEDRRRDIETSRRER
ncbi:MAG: envelope stress response membrane protein PspB [Allosphingosinicella sp.]|jgi:phage shock protein B